MIVNLQRDFNLNFIVTSELVLAVAGDNSLLTRFTNETTETCRAKDYETRFIGECLESHLLVPEVYASASTLLFEKVFSSRMVYRYFRKSDGSFPTVTKWSRNIAGKTAGRFSMSAVSDNCW